MSFKSWEHFKDTENTMNEKNIYTVSTLNQEVNVLLTDHFRVICVTGEISNLSRPSSGHLYFSLKDENAQIRCAFFRFQQQRNTVALENGQQVILYAQVSVYEPRGDYQLIVKSVELSGVGTLQIAFEQLKIKLEKAGLFNPDHKKLLPVFPKKIAVITSPTGAALQDIIKVHQKRFPAIPVLLYPVAVQGNDAKTEIVNAIKKANHEKSCDVIILARGGGSLEDLWAFNEEIVAHAIFDSETPIITGIGHQTDFTIADFVADVRAPTPSAAVEMATPDKEAVFNQLAHVLQRLIKGIRSTISAHQLQLHHLEKRLQHPKEKLQQQAQKLDQMENQLHRAMLVSLQQKKMALTTAIKTLDALSPLKVLHRGFSITKNKHNQKVILSVKDVKVADEIITTFCDGEINSTVM